MTIQFKDTFSILSTIILLSACSTNSISVEPTTETSDIVPNETESVLTVLTVGFSSSTPIPNLNITLKDATTGQEIAV